MKMKTKMISNSNPKTINLMKINKILIINLMKKMIKENLMNNLMMTIWNLNNKKDNLNRNNFNKFSIRQDMMMIIILKNRKMLSIKIKVKKDP